MMHEWTEKRHDVPLFLTSGRLDFDASRDATRRMSPHACV